MSTSKAVRRFAVAAVVTLSGLVGVAGPATATDSDARPSEARIIGKVRIDRHDPTIGYVRARYRCTGEGTLWVSVKQTADRKADPRLAEEGSSQISAAWSDSHRNPVICNGRWQVNWFTVDQIEPYFGPNGPTGQKSDIYEPLAKGKGWVQFCLFDDTTGPEVPVTAQRFAKVR